MQHDFHYISKKDPKVREAYQDIQAILKKTQDLLRQKFTFRFDVVGSYKRNMITYDIKSNMGYDFDFNIEVNDDKKYTPRRLKNILQDAIGTVCVEYGYDFPEDSTRVLTIKKKNRKKACIIHSCDFAIVKNCINDDGNEYQKYIHFDKVRRNYTWSEQPVGYYRMPDKIDWIKENDLQDDMRKLYIEKKNKNNDLNVHSRSIFAATVHEMCQKSGFYENQN